MPVQIGAKPDSGFEDPIGMLADCHRRIEHFLEILCVVADRAAGRALTSEESTAVKAALEYFRVGGRRHTADEEESLFPRLQDALPRADVAEIGALESDHNEANQLHEAVERLFRAWIEAGDLKPKDQAGLLAATQRLGQLYQQHIRVEEQIVFPRAAKVLDKETIATIGREFRARRK